MVTKENVPRHDNLLHVDMFKENQIINLCMEAFSQMPIVPTSNGRPLLKEICIIFDNVSF